MSRLLRELMGFPFRIGLNCMFFQMQSFVVVGVNMPYQYRVALENLLEMSETSFTPDCKNVCRLIPKENYFP